MTLELYTVMVADTEGHTYDVALCYTQPQAVDMMHALRAAQAARQANGLPAHLKTVWIETVGLEEDGTLEMEEVAA